MSRLTRAFFALLLVAVALPLPARSDAQPAAAASGSTTGTKKVLRLEDYGGWNRVAAAALSSDGKWMTYQYTPNEGDPTLFIRMLDADKLHTVANGSGAVFSDDSRWVAYQANPSTAARGGGGGSVRRLELLDLLSGEKSDYPNITSVRFSPDSKYLLLKKGGDGSAAGRGAAPPSLPPTAGRGPSAPAAIPLGTDLVIRNLLTGEMRNIGNVSQFALDRDGKFLAYFVAAADRLGNGVFLLELSSGLTTQLDAMPRDYDQLTWSEDGSALAALRGERKPGKVLTENTLVVFTAAGTGARKKVEVGTEKLTGVPEGFIISEYTALSWSKDAGKVFFGIKQQESEPVRSGQPVANVDVWHWKDAEPQSVQMLRLNAARRATQQAVYHVAGDKFVRLSDDVLRNVAITADAKWGVGRVDTTYRYEVTWGGAPGDFYRVNLETGERTLIAKNLSRTMGTSVDGRWFTYLDSGSVIAANLETLEKLNLSKLAGVNFVDESDDHPYEKPSYGIAGWSKDGKSVLLNHDFDIYSVPLSPAGKVVNLTGGTGEKEQIRFRIVRLERDGDGSINTARPIVLSAMGEWTKKSGYYELRAGKLSPLIYDDASIAGLAKAAKAERMMFTRQTFNTFGDYWVSGTSLSTARKITDANPQLADYAWGSKVLVDYTNRTGQRLQGTLTLPAGYEPGRRYPMLVYFYERMSDQHHRFSMPVFDDRPQMSTYASDGYLVLQPDIVYEIGKPGTSALDCVTSAVKKVIEMGYADPQRIGLQGHSWGGYESSFIVTQTDMFAAVVTGAPVTNMVSFYGELYKSSGTVQQGIMERGQVRMGVGYFDNKELYESQSPLHNAAGIKTPFMILHGTEDGAVDWHQGLEFFNAAKRLGKQVILLSYPGEAHHLGRKENQKDFQVRMKQFFDHYLKGTPMPEWMADGVPQIRKAG